MSRQILNSGLELPVICDIIWNLITLFLQGPHVPGVPGQDRPALFRGAAAQNQAGRGHALRHLRLPPECLQRGRRRQRQRERRRHGGGVAETLDVLSGGQEDVLGGSGLGTKTRPPPHDLLRSRISSTNIIDAF